MIILNLFNNIIYCYFLFEIRESQSYTFASYFDFGPSIFAFFWYFINLLYHITQIALDFLLGVLKGLVIMFIFRFIVNYFGTIIAWFFLKILNLFIWFMEGARALTTKKKMIRVNK